MLLNDEAACHGHRSQGRTIGLCIGCARYHAQTRAHIAPAAARQPTGEWDCSERRSLGHVPDGAPSGQSVAPLALGPRSGVSGFAGAQTEAA